MNVWTQRGLNRNTPPMLRFLAGVSLLLFATGAFASDWNQWRGPTRDGVMAAIHPNGGWPKALKPEWKVDVGEGHSSPVVAADRIFLLSRKGDNELVTSLSLATGKVIWQQSYPAPYEVNSAAAAHGKGPKSTPIVEQGRLYTFGISGILSAFDADGGKLLWRKDFSKQFKSTSPTFGTAMSPAITDGRLIAHVGTDNDGALAAFDIQTGEPVWSWRNDGPSYASPIILTLGGVRQIITQSHAKAIGVAFADGKLLWEVPFSTPYDQNIVTPLVYKDLLIFSGTGQRTFAVRVTQAGGKWSTQEVWGNRDVSMYMSSPVLRGDFLYGFTEKRKGTLFCLDARTGKVAWMAEGRQGDNASLVLAGEDLLVLTTEGELLVVPADPKAYQVTASYEVADTPVWAHLVIAGNRVLIKDRASLAAWLIE